MTITFHGAAQTVTGSKHLLTLDDGRRILLDCGLFQGMGRQTATLNEDFGFDPASVDVVFLSHAHIDHSGLLPKLVAEGFTGKIWCTAATRELAGLLLMDSVQVQAHAHPDADHAPCYTTEDVKDTVAAMELIPFDEWITPLEDIRVLYTRTGHLSGAAAIYLDVPSGTGRTTLAFSGDVGRSRHPLWLPAAAFPQADYLILESTYGDKHHDLALSNVDILLGHIRHTCLEKKGKLIIPAFSVGRTQELLYVLHRLEEERRLPGLSYFVDSPLGIAATKMIRAQVEEYGDRLQELLAQGQDPFSFAGLKYVETPEDSIRLLEFPDPCVIIASSGTADAGRVRFHIHDALGDSRHTILFSGYCGPDSLGGTLLRGARTVTIGNEEISVHAEIDQLKGLSAHGDTDDLCQFIGCQDPSLVRGVFLVHGERRARERLSVRLKAKGFYPILIPQPHETVQMNRHAVTVRPTPSPFADNAPSY